MNVALTRPCKDLLVLRCSMQYTLVERQSVLQFSPACLWSDSLIGDTNADEKFWYQLQLYSELNHDFTR